MKIGIGLPNPVPNTPGEILQAWARRAEEAGFSTLATIDRIVYPSYESLISLAAAAAVTERIELLSNILIAPLREPVLLAKQAASVARLARGRFVLGMSTGGREDDFTATSQDFSSRGQRFDDQLATMDALWRGDSPSDTKQPCVPSPGQPVRVMIGGNTERAIERTLRWGEGWTAGGGGPAMAGDFAARVREAWHQSEREGEPRIVALTYFALGPHAQQGISDYLGDYYAFLGEWVEQIVASTPSDDKAVKELAAQFRDAGVDELIFDPALFDLDQVDRLAEVVL